MQFQKTILVVDDNGSHRLLPGLILRPLGYTVLECASGLEAMDVLKTVPVSGVLLDIQMPGLNGLDVLRAIRSNPSLSRTKVIAYTAYATAAEIDPLIAQGFNDVLIKPIKSMQLIKIVAN